MRELTGDGCSSVCVQYDLVEVHTGCRSGEIRNLKWDEVGDNTLDLADSKTGPRRAYLNSEARAIIKRQPRTGNSYVFPSPHDPSRPLAETLSLWYRVRKRAGIEDVRLHDLRHNFASWAVMRGVPLPTVATLLGHRQVSMTLRYAHVHDKEVEAAAERVGKIMGIIYGSAHTLDHSGRGTATTPTGSRIVRNASSGVIFGQNFTRNDSLREVSLWMKQLGYRGHYRI